MANDGIVNRTFVTAHPLTGRIDLAEKATLEAIDAWKADIESVEAIFGHGVAGALRKRERRDASCLSEDNGTHSYLPAELRAVLELRLVLLRSFVLRLLAGFSREDCAELLGCPPERVDRAARTAVRLLPSFETVNSRGECMEHQEVDQSKLDQVAYDFWLQRGCPTGSPEEDWFRAEQKLRREALDPEAPAVDASIAPIAAEG
jgi:hypothetical protein